MSAPDQGDDLSSAITRFCELATPEAIARSEYGREIMRSIVILPAWVDLPIEDVLEQRRRFHANAEWSDG